MWKNQLIMVANRAGTVSRKNLRQALLIIDALASSTLPALASLIGFIEQTYPEITKKIVTETIPPGKISRIIGSVST
jgi:hypothetical protein